MSYNITSKTYALFIDNNITKIIEENKTLYIKENLIDILNYNCYKYGSSFEGRKQGSSFLIKTRYKPPIILNEYESIILIPTHSSRNNLCSWFVLNNILNYYPKTSTTTIVEFKNNTKINVNVSYSVFDKQVLKATRLESILRGRNNQKYL